MQRKTVLIVERDAKEAARILKSFRENGFRNKLIVVGSKAEAVDYIFSTGRYANRSEEDAPGLILLDLLTNKTSEVEKLKPLQWYLRTEQIPIVILTSSADQEKDIDEYHLGSIAMVRKPFDFTQVIEAFQQMGSKVRADTMPSWS